MRGDIGMKDWRVCFFTYILILLLCWPLAGANENTLRQHSFSLVIREGFGSIAVGDMNTTLKSFNSMFDVMRNLHPERCVGEITEIPNNYVDWEVELQWNIASGFIIGVAVSGPTPYHDRSFLTYTIVDLYYVLTQTDNFTFDSDIKVSIPIKLNVYRSFAISPKVSFFINGGLGYYQARLAQSYIIQIRTPDDANLIRIENFNVSGKRMGPHCGAELEYKFNNRFSMLVEGQFNLSRIKHFSGTSFITNQTFDEKGNLVGSISVSDKGILYHYIGEDWDVGVPREKFIVSPSPPEIGYDFPRDVREAFLDLRGFTIRIGLKIRLF